MLLIFFCVSKYHDFCQVFSLKRINLRTIVTSVLWELRVLKRLCCMKYFSSFVHQLVSFLYENFQVFYFSCNLCIQFLVCFHSQDKMESVNIKILQKFFFSNKLPKHIQFQICFFNEYFLYAYCIIKFQIGTL